jgi:adenylate cyclase
VRKAADKVRITAQLIDAETGDHVWASRFDQEGADVVAIQEDVANGIYDSLAGLTGEIQQNQQQYAWRKSAPGLEEYDYYLRGHQLFFQFTPEDNARARQIWQKGLTRFPESALLRNKLAWTYLRDIWTWQSSDLERDLQRAWSLGKEVEAAQNKSRLATWLNHWRMAWLYQWQKGDLVRSIAEAKTALQMVPYDAFSRADLANVVANAGRTDLAIEWAMDAMRRDPECPEWMCVWSLAWAYYLAGRPEDALAELQKMSQPLPLTLAAV